MDNITTKNGSDSPELNAELQSDKHSPIHIKEEPRDEIKDYAETTMNELLSWYGYEKVSSKDTEKINFERYTNSGEGDEQLSHLDGASIDDASLDSCDSSSGKSDLSRFELSRSNSESSLAAQHRNLVTALTKKHGLTGAPEGTLPSGYIVCAWCQKPGVKLFTLKTSTRTKAFCSEVCFTQCRRASFKKNKICDWCKHVRHTVNYVDFQDGETQLQFCGSKCLNQYKMNIFCKETQEHLQQIQSPKDVTSGKKSPEKQILITPDLWLKHGKESTRVKETKDFKDSTKEDTQSDMVHDMSNKGDSKPEVSDSHTSPHSYTESEKLPTTNRSILDRVDREKHKKTLPRETNNNSAATPVDLHGMASNFTTPGLASMAHLVPPHMWNAFGFGMPPFGAMPPWYYPGLMPPGFPGVTPPTPNVGLENVSPRAHNRASTSARSTADNDSDSSPGTPSIRIRTPKQTSTSSKGGHVRSETPRNTSNNPMLPGLLGMNMPPYFQSGQNGMPLPDGSSMQGVPPVTMIMPVPVPLPLPVPIPLPLPLTMEKIMEVYSKTKGKNAEGKQKNHKQHYPINNREAIYHQYHNVADSSKIIKSDINENDTASRDFLSCISCNSDRSESVNSCPEPSPESRPLSRECFSESHKRPLTPQIDGSLDLSKRVRLEDSFSDSCDGAIDLSNSGNVKNKYHSARENGDQNDSDASVNDTDTERANGEFPLKVPKIHIISPRPDPPLSQHLPLPPVDPKYSSRRGLILDAPSVPKKQRSPSPDRRSYARTVPRDVMEAARRRCLRARIRTK